METLLPADVQIMPMAESFPVFIPVSGGKLLLRETFGNQIYCLEDGNAVPIFEFDFGTYSIPDEYYEMDDVKESVNYIMQRDFVCIDRFMENKKYVFVQALLKKRMTRMDWFTGFWINVRSNGSGILLPIS